MSVVTTVPIGLQAYLQTFNLSTTPQQLYSGLNVPGRYMLVFIQNGVSLLGGVDFILDGININLISFYNFIGVTKGSTPFSLGLKDGSNIIYLEYQDNNILVSCTENTIDIVSVKSFIIATTYSGQNLYSVDKIVENTPNNGIIIDGNIETPTVTLGAISFIDVLSTSIWSSVNTSARRIGKIVHLSGSGTLNVGSLGISSNTPIEMFSVSPSEKFVSSTPVTGTIIIKIIPIIYQVQ